MALDRDPFEIVVMRAKAPGSVVLPGDGRQPIFEMGGTEYVVDPTGLVRVPDPVEARLARPAAPPEVSLRQALRACVQSGVSDSRIVDIVNLELVSEVMRL